MSDYFDEMGRTPLRDGETPDSMLHMARFLRDSGMWELWWRDTELPPPASKDAVNDLPDVVIESVESKQCPVCLKDFQPDDKAKRMPCRHVFHEDCILPWLRKVRGYRSIRYRSIDLSNNGTSPKHF